MSNIIEQISKWKIPVVDSHSSVENPSDFLEKIRHQQEGEGVVVCWNNGHRIKIKTELYCQMHKTLESFHLEKDMIRLILDEKLDDAKPFLSSEMLEKSERFSNDLLTNIKMNADLIYSMSKSFHELLNGDKKRLALEIIGTNEKLKLFSQFIYNSFSNLEAGPEKVLLDMIEDVKKHTTSQSRVDKVRHIFGGINWKDYNQSVVILEE